MINRESVLGALRSEVMVAFLVCAFFALWITVPIVLTGSWYYSHDGIRYPYLSYRFMEVFNHGVLYPRWMPELAGGYGYPTFVFYQPGYFFLSLPFQWLMSPLKATYFTIFLILWAGAMGGYKLARLFAPFRLSLLLAVIFIFSPYVAMNLFRRGDFSELLSMLLVPWSLYAAFVLCDAVEKGTRILKPAALFACATAAVVVTHPFVAFFYIPFVTLFFIVRSHSLGWNREILWVGFVVLGIAATLSAPYWFVALQMKPYVTYQGAVSGFYSPLNQLSSIKRVALGVKPGYFLFQVAALLGFAVAWKRSPIFRLMGLYMLFLLFMNSGHSRFIWEAGYGLLKYLQFPGRQMSVNTTLQFMGIILLATHLADKYASYKRIGMFIACCALITLFADCHKRFHLLPPVHALAKKIDNTPGRWAFLRGQRLPSRNYFVDIQAKELERFETMAATGEFRPKGMNTKGLRHRLKFPVPAVEFIKGEKHGSTLDILESSTIVAYDFVVTAKQATSLLINQMYLPGWVVEADGRRLKWEQGEQAMENEKLTLRQGDNGRIQLNIEEAGTYRLRAWYDGPPYWKLRNGVICGMLGLLVMLLVHRKRVLSKKLLGRRL